MKVEFLILLQLSILIFVPTSIWCEQDSSEDKFECEDTSNHCSSLLKTNSGLCNGDYQEYFAKRCKKSCGLCALAKLENKLKGQTEMIVELQTQRDELIEKKNGLTSQVGDLTNKVGDLTNKFGDLTNKFGDLTNKFGDLTRKNSDLTRKNSDLTRKNSDLTNKVTDLIEKVTLNTKKDIGITKEITDLKEKQNSPIAFRAYRQIDSGFTGTITSWSTTTRYFQQGAAFNPSSGVFTAPSDGLYAFNIFIETWEGSNDVIAGIYHNGAKANPGWVRAKDDDLDNSSHSTIVELKKQDTVYASVYSWEEKNKIAVFFFNGYRVTKT